VIGLKIGVLLVRMPNNESVYQRRTEPWSNPNENPPIELILCSEENDAVVHYSRGNRVNTVLSPNYEVAPPSERRRTQQLKKTPETLQRRFQLPPAPRV
jgi:hypothetical protein